MSQISRLWDVLLVNSNPIKKKTGEYVLPCYTSTGRKFLGNRMADVRVVEVKAAISQQKTLEVMTDMYPDVGELMKRLGLELNKPKKSKAK